MKTIHSHPPLHHHDTATAHLNRVHRPHKAARMLAADCAALHCTLPSAVLQCCCRANGRVSRNGQRTAATAAEIAPDAEDGVGAATPKRLQLLRMVLTVFALTLARNAFLGAL